MVDIRQHLNIVLYSSTNLNHIFRLNVQDKETYIQEVACALNRHRIKYCISSLGVHMIRVL